MALSFKLPFKRLIRADSVEYRGDGLSVGFDFRGFVEKLFGKRRLGFGEKITVINPEEDPEKDDDFQIPEDFLGEDVSSLLWTKTNSGSATITVAGSTALLETNLTSNSKSLLNSRINEAAANRKFEMETKLRFTINTNFAEAEVGFLDDNVPNEYIAWKIDTAGQIFPATKNAGSTNGSNISFTNGVWIILKIIVFSGSKVEFYLNNVLKQTITTNIPADSLPAAFLVQNGGQSVNEKIEIAWVRTKYY